MNAHDKFLARREEFANFLADARAFALAIGGLGEYHSHRYPDESKWLERKSQYLHRAIRKIEDGYDAYLDTPSSHRRISLTNQLNRLANEIPVIAADSHDAQEYAKHWVVKETEHIAEARRAIAIFTPWKKEETTP